MSVEAPGRIGLRDFASVVLIVTIWTLFLVLARQGVKGSFTPWDMAFLRFSFAAVVVLPVFLSRPAGRRLGRLAPGQALVIALFAGLGFSCLAYVGFSYAPAAHGAVLMPGVLPFSVAVISWFVLGERMTRRKLASLGLILAGVMFIAWHAFSTADARDGAWRGDILFPLASGCWAFFVVLVRRWQVDAVDATLATVLISCMLYTPVYLLFLPKQIAAAPVLDLLWQGVFQGVLALVVSMWLYTRVVRAFGPSRTTMITALCPGLAALIAVPMLGEPLSLLVMLGLAAVTAGMVTGVTGRATAPALQPAAAQRVV